MTELLSKISIVLSFYSNRLVDHLEKCNLFSDFQYGWVLGLGSFCSIADLLIVASNKIAKLLISLRLLDL